MLNAAMAQVVEHILGKDEVTSSNLVSSSLKRSPFWRPLFVWRKEKAAGALLRLFMVYQLFFFTAKDTKSSIGIGFAK